MSSVAGGNTIRAALERVTKIELPMSDAGVHATVADIFIRKICTRASIVQTEWGDSLPAPGTVRVTTGGHGLKSKLGLAEKSLPEEGDWLYVKLDSDGTGYILSSGRHYLVMLTHHILEDLLDKDISSVTEGKLIPVTFTRHRPWYDQYINQHARTVKHLDHDEYFANLARIGFSHAEVNGLAFPVQYETGPKGEVLHRFFTYCPALDQFVTSRLNKGIYKDDYLQANLNYLKSNVSYAEKYGLTPGLVCFEPRSVPDALLQRYPMLRGARVDHPLRSFHPRFNLSIAHPVVRDHYAEMMEKLLREVPRLEYISIWSNDSGAGFEYTSSLYVGRNGGGYVIREWKGDTEIAEAAALNLVRYLKLLRDAGRKVNPNFRVVLRFEAFSTELEYIIRNLEEGIDVEAVSYKSKGWGLEYTHPVYNDVTEVHQTVLHNDFDAGEIEPMERLHNKGAMTEVVYAPDVIWNHEPLTGIPYPFLIGEKLKAMAGQGVRHICHLGGATPPVYAPYNINQEIIRAFQLDSAFDPVKFVRDKAVQWAGEEYADELAKIWKLADDAFRSFPVPIWIYSAWGVWYRLFIRPIIPNIEAIPEKDREYYEDFLISTPHNRARVDFRYDVGFELTDSPTALKAMRRMDEKVFPVLDEAIESAGKMVEKSNGTNANACLRDQFDRLRALRYWIRNQRNVAAWVGGVHGYLETEDRTKRSEFRKLLRDMVFDEIENTKKILELWEGSKTKWMYFSGVGETSFIYGENLGKLLKRKIELMKGHEDDEPYIDPDFQWRVPGIPWSYKNTRLPLNELI